MILEIDPTVKLDACKLCGSEAIMKAETDFFTGITGVRDRPDTIAFCWVKCTNPECGISPKASKTKDEAISRWNRRHDL